LNRPDIHDFFVLKRAREAAGLSQARVHELQKAEEEIWRAAVLEARERLPAQEYDRIASYLTVGSQNMDYRGMMMDGEVLYVTSGLGVFPAFPDFLTILGSCTWVDDLQALHDRIPEYSEWQRQVGRYIKYAL
jgi:hypothetical protein